MMIRLALKGVSLSFAFIGASYISVKFLGFNWVSFTALIYLMVLNSFLAVVASESGVLEHGFSGVLDRLVLVIEGEELKMKKLFSGEKYKVKGELEKL